MAPLSGVDQGQFQTDPLPAGAIGIESGRAHRSGAPDRPRGLRSVPSGLGAGRAPSSSPCARSMIRAPRKRSALISPCVSPIAPSYVHTEPARRRVSHIFGRQDLSPNVVTQDSQGFVIDGSIYAPVFAGRAKRCPYKLVGDAGQDRMENAVIRSRHRAPEVDLPRRPAGQRTDDQSLRLIQKVVRVQDRHLRRVRPLSHNGRSPIARHPRLRGCGEAVQAWR